LLQLGVVTRNNRVYHALNSTNLGKVSLVFSQFGETLVSKKGPAAGATSQMAIAPAPVVNFKLSSES